MQTITVAVRGLEELEGGGNVAKIGSKPIHPMNHFGTSQLLKSLVALGNALRAAVDSISEEDRRLFRTLCAEPLRLPMVLSVNDISLPQGGVFDYLKANYEPPHGEHHRGVAADVDVRRGCGDDYYAILLQRVWENELGHHVGDERVDKNHFHLFL